MIPRLKRHLTSPATGIAVVALVAALGGSAVASHITGKSIKNGSVTGTDIKNNSLTGVDMTDVKGGDIKDESIESKDIKDGTIASGDVATGTFEPSASLVGSTVTTRTATLVVTAAGTASQTAVCTANEVVVGGGYGDPDDLDAGNDVTEDHRDSTSNGWEVEVKDAAAGDGDTVTVRAECAEIK